MTILNREGRQACRVGCREVLCCQQNTSKCVGCPALWGRIHRLFLATGESNGLQGWLSSCMRYQPYSWSDGSYFPVCRLRSRIRVGVQRAVEALTGFSFEFAVPVPPSFFLGRPLAFPLSSWGHGGVATTWKTYTSALGRQLPRRCNSSVNTCQCPARWGRCSTRVLSFGFQGWGSFMAFEVIFFASFNYSG